jgi:hypothetical protein
VSGARLAAVLLQEIEAQQRENVALRREVEGLRRELLEAGASDRAAAGWIVAAVLLVLVGVQAAVWWLE